MSINRRVDKDYFEPSKTKQSFKDECDITKIMKRFKQIHGVDFLKVFKGPQGGSFGDFSGVSDYRSAIDAVDAAKAKFMALPAVLRKRFGNDPAQFIDFVQNPSNLDEMIKLGLATKRAPVQDAPSQPVSTPSAVKA